MIIRVEYDVELPDMAHTEEELEAFIRYETGDNGHLDGDNPFSKEHFEPIFGTFTWEYEDVDWDLIKETP